jgi:hypothetical protein
MGGLSIAAPVPRSPIRVIKHASQAEAQSGWTAGLLRSVGISAIGAWVGLGQCLSTENVCPRMKFRVVGPLAQPPTGPIAGGSSTRTRRLISQTCDG